MLVSLAFSPFWIVLVFLCLAVPSSSFAQYLFFDTDRDRLGTAGDGISPTDTTRIDVWLQTDRRRDGSPLDVRCKPCTFGPCPAMTLSGYKLQLRAANGTLRWLDWKNAMPGMKVHMPFKSDSGHALVAYLGPGVPPGRYKLGTLRVLPRSGTPSIAPILWTGYNTECRSRVPGGWLNFDQDWREADTLKYLGVPNEPPVIQEPGTVSVLEADTLEFVVTARDPDPNQRLRFRKGESPAWFTLETIDPGQPVEIPDVGTGTLAKARVRITPGMCDRGYSHVQVEVTDGFVSHQTILHVEVRDRPLKRDPNPLSFRGVSLPRKGPTKNPPLRGEKFLEGEWESVRGSQHWFDEYSASSRASQERLVFRSNGTYERADLDETGRHVRSADRYEFHKATASSSADTLSLSGAGGTRYVLVRGLGPDSLELVEHDGRYGHGHMKVSLASTTHVFVRVAADDRGSLVLNPPEKTPGLGARGLYLPREMERALRSLDPAFRPWEPREMETSLASAMEPGSPGTVIGDFDGDLRPDVALYGRGRDRSRLIVILSDHGRVRLLEVASTDRQPEGSDILRRPAASLHLVRRGTTLPPCDGRGAHFDTDGLAIEVGSGHSYHYVYQNGAFREYVHGN